MSARAELKAQSVNRSAHSVENLPTLSVVLVCWNNREYLQPCLASLFDAALPFQLEVVVVDNGSTDGSQEMLSDQFPQVSLIQNEDNVGLSRASNQGILASKGDYVLLLNNDTLVDRASLEALYRCLQDRPRAGGAGGTLLNPDGSVQSAAGTFSSLGQEFLIATGLGRIIWPIYPDHRTADEPRPVDWLSSACLMLRRCALDEVGLLDEEYFIYGDEADLQYRLRKAGWQVYYLPQATTVHFGGRSMNRWSRRKMVYRGKMMFYKKNYGLVKTVVLRAMLGFLSYLKILAWAIVWLVPGWRPRASKEIASNRDVLALSFNLQ